MITFACQDIEFSDLLRCSFELNKTEYNVLMYLLMTEKQFSAADIGKHMKLDRTTVQQAVKKLAEKNLIKRLQQNLGKGGYTFSYCIKDKSNIKDRMLKIVEEWHSSVVSEIGKW